MGVGGFVRHGTVGGLPQRNCPLGWAMNGRFALMCCGPYRSSLPRHTLCARRFSVSKAKRISASGITMLRVARGIGACRKSCPGGSWVGLGFSAWPNAWEVRARKIAARELTRFENIAVDRWAAICWKTTRCSIQTKRLAKFWLANCGPAAKIAHPRFGYSK